MTKEEFLSLCQFTAKEHTEPESASKVLLTYFLSKKNWTENVKFCKQVSNISFVPVEQLPELCWIKSPYQSSRIGRRILKEEKIVELTKLNGSGIVHHKCCLWTIMSIVSLPQLSHIKEELLLALGVTNDPTVEQVITNLKNISSIK